jgi:3'(2'), 5'-bisphosphate nucleotidase
MNLKYKTELDAALEAAESAGRELVRLYADFQRIADAPADITTDADRRAQEIILARLQRQFPADAYCAEETTPGLKDRPSQGPRLWIIDPIDGTRGFARKNGEFSIMIAFVENGVIGAGVVLEPARQRLTYAVHGGGCWKRDGNGVPVRARVSPTSAIADATLTRSRSRTTDPSSHKTGPLQTARVLESYSAGIKLALVARADADIYLNYYGSFHDWDICAGHILVEEAGGKVTGLHGESLHYGLPGALQQHGLLASNGELHDLSLAAVRGTP